MEMENVWAGKRETPGKTQWKYDRDFLAETTWDIPVTDYWPGSALSSFSQHGALGNVESISYPQLIHQAWIY